MRATDRVAVTLARAWVLLIACLAERWPRVAGDEIVRIDCN